MQQSCSLYCTTQSATRRCRTPKRNQSRVKTTATASHTSCHSSRAAATTVTGKKHTFFALRHRSPRFVMYCYVSICKYCRVCICIDIAIPVTEMFLSVTRKIASQLPVITLRVLQLTMLLIQYSHTYYCMFIHYNTATLRTWSTLLPFFLHYMHC